MGKKLQKDIEREAFGSAKQDGYRGKALKYEAGYRISMAEYENRTSAKKELSREKGDVC